MRSRQVLFALTMLFGVFAWSQQPGNVRPSLANAIQTTHDDLIILNPNVDSRNGETAEFSTLSTVIQRFQQLSREKPTGLIGLGEAFPFSGNSDKTAYEVFVWNDGSKQMAYISDPATGESRPLGDETPLTFSVFDFVDLDKGSVLVYDSRNQAGKVLWNFHTDQTEKQVLFFKKGFHNSYSGSDGKATENLFNAAKEAHSNRLLDAKWRARLRPFLPALSEDAVWSNFSNSTTAPENETTWLSLMRKQGWLAAAFVMEGSLLEANHFRVTKVNNLEPHGGALKPKDYFLESEAGSSDWLIVGYMIDPQHHEFEQWQQSLEAFGQGIHFHGVRADGKKMGHVLTAVLSAKPFRVTMYPLRVLQSENSGVFNNDLSTRFGTAAPGQTAFEVTVENAGANFVRNVEVSLQEGSRKETTETITVPVIKPGENLKISLKSRRPWSSGNTICAVVDPDEKLIEGGKMKVNNRVCLR